MLSNSGITYQEHHSKWKRVNFVIRLSFVMSSDQHFGHANVGAKSVSNAFRGGSKGGGPGGQDTHPPPLFGGPPSFIKREKTSRACARIGHILVLNSYADPPLSKILYPPLCIGSIGLT